MGIGDTFASAMARLPIYGALHRSFELVYNPADPAFRVDYLEGAGDPGALGPDSLTWRVMANPLVFAIGAVPAVILQLAEEGVGTGVDTFSDYKVDTLGRTQRTLSAALASTYASRQAKAGLMREVASRHAKVRGQLSDGGRYTAFDPERMAFVHLTANMGFAAAYERFVLGRPLTLVERDQLIQEGAAITADYGRFEIPRTAADAEALVRSFEPRLKRGAPMDNFIAVARGDAGPGIGGRGSKQLLFDAGLDLLPDWAKDKFGLRRSALREAATIALLRPLARFVPRLLKDTPPQLSCRRMGLPDDHLFRPVPKTAGAGRAGAPVDGLSRP
ncbi:MAG: oxygenase MpaB family protein [Zavarzinia sp.]|nr:oxygenase MpaB family protein [Zavarzinia sp.]